jgi:hypothetical protein
LGYLLLWGREGVTLIIQKKFEVFDEILIGSNLVK